MVSRDGRFQDPTRRVASTRQPRESDELAARDWNTVAKRIQTGDAVALAELFSAYAVRLCAYAWRAVSSREVAEELVQDVFLNIWMNRETLHVTDSIVLYLFRAVRNRVINYLRHEQIVAQHRASEPVPGYSGNDRKNWSDEALAQRELYEAVTAAVDTLPERSREIFLLNRESGLTYVQIADMLDISVKTVEYHMGRAFTLLRRRLADWTVV